LGAGVKKNISKWSQREHFKTEVRRYKAQAGVRRYKAQAGVRRYKSASGLEGTKSPPTYKYIKQASFKSQYLQRSPRENRAYLEHSFWLHTHPTAKCEKWLLQTTPTVIAFLFY
jgi:hypothetical protein